MTGRRVSIGSGSEYEAAVGYSRAVRTGEHIVVAGITGAGDDIAEQARDALRRIDRRCSRSAQYTRGCSVTSAR